MIGIGITVQQEHIRGRDVPPIPAAPDAALDGGANTGEIQVDFLIGSIPSYYEHYEYRTGAGIIETTAASWIVIPLDQLTAVTRRNGDSAQRYLITGQPSGFRTFQFRVVNIAGVAGPNSYFFVSAVP